MLFFHVWNQESSYKSRSIRNAHGFLCFFRFIDNKRSRKQPDSSASGCLSEVSLINKPLRASTKQRLKSKARVERTSCSIGASIPCATCLKIIQSSCSSSR
ncbi:hypothetical protein AMTRI_Chr06g195800 [Amborella trichopoda]